MTYDLLYRISTWSLDHERLGLSGGSNLCGSGQTVTHSATRWPTPVASPFHVRSKFTGPLRIVNDAQQRKCVLGDWIQSATQLGRKSRITAGPTVQLTVEEIFRRLKVVHFTDPLFVHTTCTCITECVTACWLFRALFASFTQRSLSLFNLEWINGSRNYFEITVPLYLTRKYISGTVYVTRINKYVFNDLHLSS